MVGRVVNGQTRRAAVAGAVAAGRICGWWAPWGPDSAHRGLTVPAGSSSTSPVSADHRRPILTAAYSTVLCTSPAAYCRKPPSTWGNTTGAGLHNIYYRTSVPRGPVLLLGRGLPLPGLLLVGTSGSPVPVPLAGGGSGAPLPPFTPSTCPLCSITEQYAHGLRPTRRSSDLDSHCRCRQNLPGCLPNGCLKEE